jgi:hypothetical protein
MKTTLRELAIGGTEARNIPRTCNWYFHMGMST